jgi:glucose-1-phosphate adenylyltransferase
VEIGEKARIKNAIIDRGVRVPPNDIIGFDAEKDRKRFAVSDSGIVILSHGSRNLIAE